AKERLEREVLVEKQREPESERELDDARNRRVEERVEEREPRDRVSPEELEVLEADPLTRAPNFRVGEPEVGPETERIREEDNEQRGGRREEDEPERVATAREPRERRGAPVHRAKQTSNPLARRGGTRAMGNARTRIVGVIACMSAGACPRRAVPADATRSN